MICLRKNQLVWLNEPKEHGFLQGSAAGFLLPLSLTRAKKKSCEFSVFNTPINERYFEDYIEHDIHRFGSITVAADEVIAFARRFDPQPFHVDPDAAKATRFGGLIASGWHTGALTMRLFADHYLTRVASLGSPGLDELRWLRPARPGDTLSLRVTVLKAVPSKSKPDRGAITSLVEVFNQADELVMTFKCVNIIARRPSG
jgi:acyl dehydratase